MNKNRKIIWFSFTRIEQSSIQKSIQIGNEESFIGHTLRTHIKWKEKRKKRQEINLMCISIVCTSTYTHRCGLISQGHTATAYAFRIRIPISFFFDFLDILLHHTHTHIHTVVPTTHPTSIHVCMEQCALNKLHLNVLKMSNGKVHFAYEMKKTSSSNIKMKRNKLP